MTHGNGWIYADAMRRAHYVAHEHDVSISVAAKNHQDFAIALAEALLAVYASNVSVIGIYWDDDAVGTQNHRYRPTEGSGVSLGSLNLFRSRVVYGLNSPFAVVKLAEQIKTNIHAYREDLDMVEAGDVKYPRT